MANDAHIIAAPVEVTKQGSTPAAPAAGTLMIYPKTDDNWYKQTSGGVETVLGGGGIQRTFAFFES